MVIANFEAALFKSADKLRKNIDAAEYKNDEEDDGIPFEEKMKDLTATLKAQMEREKELDEEIKKQLAKIGFEI